MKIGIACYPTFGGSGVVATELGKALAAKGHEIHFITYNEPVRLGGLSKNITYHEVRVSDYPLFDYQPYELVLTSKMVDVARFERLDLLHVHYAIPHASAAYMAQQILKDHHKRIPFITTLHGTDITLVGKDPSFEPVITFAINKSDAVTAVSQSLKDDTYRHFGVTREIEVIPNFINTKRFKLNGKLETLRKIYAPNGEKVVTHISNFRKVKRVPDVIHVFQKIREAMPAKLLLVGDGPEKHHTEQLCREMGICDDVKHLGKLKSTEEVLGISDLFLLPSEFESFGLAALEAMACGVPVISTNTGGLPEVNIHGVTGCTGNVGDIDELSGHAIKILGDPATHAKFSDGALKQAEAFDLENILPQYEQLYASVLETVS